MITTIEKDDQKFHFLSGTLSMIARGFGQSILGNEYGQRSYEYKKEQKRFATIDDVMEDHENILQTTKADVLIAGGEIFILLE